MCVQIYCIPLYSNEVVKIMFSKYFHYTRYNYQFGTIYFTAPHPVALAVLPVLV